MFYTKRKPFIGVVLLLSLSFLIVSCDSGGGMNGDDNDNSTVTAEDNSYQTTSNKELAISAPGVLGNDSDSDGDSLNASLVSDPSDGTVTLESDGAFVYASDEGFTGTDTFEYEADDGSGNTDTAVASISVTSGDDTTENITVAPTLIAAGDGNLSGCEITLSQDGQTDTHQRCSADKQYPQNSGSVDVTGRADGRVMQDTSVSTASDHDFQLSLPTEQAQRVTKTLSATAAGPDTTIAVDFYHDTADTLIAANTAEATVTFPGSDESIPVRAERAYFDARTQSVSLAEDGEVAFALDRQTVDVEVLLETTAEAPDLSGATVKIYEPNKADSTTCTGSQCTFVDLPKRSGQRSVRITNRDTHPQTDDIRRYDPLTNSFAASENQELTASLEALAACNDGISNDPDEFVDADDPGCWNQDGEYVPSDDNEGHFFVQIVSISGGEGTTITNVVSSTPNERQFFYPDTDRVVRLEESIIDAVEVTIAVDTERDSTQADETFAAKFKCGPTQDNLNNINTSGIVPDNQAQDGWELTPIPEVETDFFNTGNQCRVVWQHGTLVRDEPTGDGNDDVFFLKPDDTQRALAIRFFVQEEDYQNLGKRSGRTLAQGRECRPNRYGKTCRKAVSDGLGSRFLRR
jgi:hypothetical protein